MFNLFGSKKQNTLTTKTSAVVQEFETGDKRVMVWHSDPQGKRTLVSLQYVPAGESLPLNIENLYIHMPEHKYRYGVSPVNEHNFYHITDAIAQSDTDDYGLLSHSRLNNTYASWIALHNDVYQSEYTRKMFNAEYVSGISGIAELFGSSPDQNIVYVSFDRFESVVAICRGEHILMHSVVPVGSSYIISALADTLHIDTQMAAKIFERHGCSFSHYEESVRSCIVNLLQPFVAVIDNCVHTATASSYRPDFLRQPLSAWVFGGIGPSIPGLVSYIGQHIPATYLQHIAPEYQSLVQSSVTTITAKNIPKFLVHFGMFAHQSV